MLEPPISSDELIKYIHNYMDMERKTLRRGWSMKDILEDVHTKWGQGAWDFAYKYIVEDYSNLKGDDSDG